MSAEANPRETAGRALLKLLDPLPAETCRRLSDLLAETPVPAGRKPLDLQVVGINDLCFLKNAVFDVADIGRPNSLPSGFVELRDAIVTPWGFVVSDGKIAVDTQFVPGGWKRGGDRAPQLASRIVRDNFIHRFDILHDFCRLSVPAEMETIDEPAFLFNSRLAGRNFAHLLHDALIQAPAFQHACARIGGELRPLLATWGFHFPAMPIVFAAALGPRARPPLFKHDAFYRVSRLFAPTIHFEPAHDAIACGAVRRLMDRLAEALQPYRRRDRRRIYVSREDSTRGEGLEPRLRNADALERALGEMGFEKLVLSRLDAAAYLEAFVNSEIIVGLHGAGIFNALLSASPRMLELTVPGYPDWNSLPLLVETGMGAPYRRLTTPPPREGFAEYDVPAIVAACRELLATPCPRPGPPL